MPGTLWYILALSLMGIITVCAWRSASRPSDPDTYIALMAAKLISTLGFVLLAYRYGGAWLLAAAGDGFVAATLWASRRLGAAKNSALPCGFARVFRGQKPFYEVWFAEIQTAPGQALWFRYTLLNGTQQIACTWALRFDETGVSAYKDPEALADLAPANCVLLPEIGDRDRFRGRPQVFHLGASRLDSRNALGRAGAISWDLTFRDSGKRFCHVPEALKALGIAKSTLESCFLDLRFSGTIRNGEQEIRIREAPGLIGHIYGKKQAHEWAWAHCNSFEGVEDAVFEGLSARVRLGKWITPPVSSFVLFLEGRRYSFSSVWRLFSAKSEFGEGKWVFGAKHRGVRIEGEARAPAPRQVAVVQYTDTDGSSLWCKNSKLSDLTVRIVDPRRGIDRTLVAKASAAFEIVNRKQPHGETTL
ncbi:MAG: hypothetical protein IT572_06175 [Deltaproteobacteria bacterium]|nr:hypothetical protein [Deltaproteobacteria bacterium]